MPSRERTLADAIRLFQNAEFPHDLNAKTAWLGIYQVLLWYEEVNWVGYDVLPHIAEANALRPSTPRKAAAWTKPSQWQQRAGALGNYLARQLVCSTADLPSKVDRLMNLPDYTGMQRQNSLGIAFAGLAKHILEHFGDAGILYELERTAQSVFPGIEFPGRSTTPRIDLLALRGGYPVAIVSSKWSVRHDRVNDITNECPIYKGAYQRIYRARPAGLRFYALTNEFSPGRLLKMLNDTCIDGLVHVHKPAVREVCGLDGRLEQMLDLSDLVDLTRQWQ